MSSYSLPVQLTLSINEGRPVFETTDDLAQHLAEEVLFSDDVNNMARRMQDENERDFLEGRGEIFEKAEEWIELKWRHYGFRVLTLVGIAEAVALRLH